MIYIIVADVPKVEVQKLSGLNQMMAVKRNLFLTALKGEWLNNPDVLNMCLKMAGSCPVYVVARPKGVDSVSAMAQVVNEID
jgi:hypothetical protein